MDRKLGGLILLACAASANAAGGWYAQEKIDPMTDKRSCVVGSLGGYEAASLMVFFSQSGTAVLVGSSAYPRTHVDIRVDTNEAIRVREDLDLHGKEAAGLLAQLRAGNEVKTRYYSWPRYQERVGTSSIGDLPAKLDQCERFVRGKVPTKDEFTGQ